MSFLSIQLDLKVIQHDEVSNRIWLEERVRLHQHLLKLEICLKKFEQLKKQVEMMKETIV